MNIRILFGVVAVAGFTGYLGGVLGSQNRVEAADSPTLKASKFELINRAGTTIATWEVDSRNEAHLRFVSAGGRSAMEIGVLSDGRPIVQMAGRDGKRRIVMELDESDKPMLGMGDERWEGRVHLGFVEPDTVSPTWDDWGLFFSGFGSERPIAGIGVVKTTEGGLEGHLTVSGKEIH